jgi:hypothetical protein
MSIINITSTINGGIMMDKKEKLIGSIVMVVGCIIFLLVVYFSSKLKLIIQILFLKVKL